MPSSQDGVDNVGSQKRQSKDAANVGGIDLFGRGQLLDGPVGGGLQQLAPPEDPFIADGWTACVLVVRWSGSSLPSRLYDCLRQKAGEASC
jgi:hypothetical protein